jgi:glutathione S-transferase
MRLQLIGRDLSPFVRRTATVIEYLGLPYDRLKLASATEPEKVAAYNRMARVPALVLEGGEVLIDSSAIIDYLLEIGDPDYTLLPPRGERRRDILRLSAYAIGVMEKGVAASYELRRRPREFVYRPWLDYVEQQIQAGLSVLEENAVDENWLFGETLTLADINAVVAYDYIATVHRKLLSQDIAVLANLSARANSLDSFRNTQWTAEP